MEVVLVKAPGLQLPFIVFCLVMPEQQDHSKEDLFLVNRNSDPYLVKECGSESCGLCHPGPSETWVE